MSTRYVPCPKCGGPMRDTSGRCQTCQLTAAEKRAAPRQTGPGTLRACKGCGVEFVAGPNQMYHAKLCRTRASGRHHTLEGGSLADYSLTTSFRDRETGAWLTTVGWGKTKSLAAEHAEEQLPPGGDWELMSKSSPSSIYHDLLRTA